MLTPPANWCALGAQTRQSQLDAGLEARLKRAAGDVVEIYANLCHLNVLEKPGEGTLGCKDPEEHPVIMARVARAVALYRRDHPGWREEDTRLFASALRAIRQSRFEPLDLPRIAAVQQRPSLARENPDEEEGARKKRKRAPPRTVRLPRPLVQLFLDLRIQEHQRVVARPEKQAAKGEVKVCDALARVRRNPIPVTRATILASLLEIFSPSHSWHPVAPEPNLAYQLPAAQKVGSKTNQMAMRAGFPARNATGHDGSFRVVPGETGTMRITQTLQGHPDKNSQ